MDVMALRGAIYGKFRHQVSFGAVIGWTAVKVSNMLLGKYVPTVDEANTIGEKLGLNQSQYCSIFADKIGR